MSSVFVSHASDDNPTVARIVTDLRAAGHTVWVDKSDLPAGGSLAGSISKGIEGSDAFLLLLSKSAAISRWVDLEWQAGLSRSMSDASYVFLLVRLDDVEVPLLLKGRKWIDLGAGYGEALEAIEKSLSPTAAAAPGKPEVWYFDDVLESLEAFVKRHSSAFEIRTFTEVVDLLSALNQATTARARVPSIILIDLYCSQDGADPDVLAETQRRLAEYFSAERELKKSVDAAWRPIGVEIVESVREFYPPEKLPIAMHTQQGLFLLRDELLQDLEKMGAGWLLKNRFSPETDRMVLERIMMQSGHQMSSGRQRVLIIDDNPKFIEAFIERQSDYFEIVALSSESEVLRALNRMDDTGEFPDIFVVDMYYPRATDDDGQKLIDAANGQLREFAELEKQLQGAVQRSYEPVGMSALKQIRRMLSADELPVLVYTQSGMLTLGDQGIQEIERLGGGWLLKDRYDVRTEQAMVLGEIFRASRKRAETGGKR